ncbi:hypothetical protein, partial [Pelobium manganitolerans]|uniref:hypothetical protein n=1 Tax=Pelobium manganitolerans TaxID=1842495 RepID=UPI003FA377C5
MKRSLYVFFLCALFFASCKKKDEVIKHSSLSFSSSEINLLAQAGKAEFTIKWAFTEWELSTNTDGFLSGFTYLKGGSQAHSNTTRVEFNYTA